MDTFLDTLLSRLAFASVQALLLAGVVYAACRFFPALSAAARSALWWLLGAQLLIGVACPAPFALPLLPAAAPARDVLLTAPTVIGDATMSVDMVPPSGAPSWSMVLLGAWGLAVVLQLIVASVRWARLSAVLRRAMAHEDVRVETLCARRARELGLRRSPRLAVSAEVDSPQVVGLWHPTILLPLDDRLDDEELEMALMHELAHVRRGDLLLGCVPALARALFFFHPLVHLATREYALCREAACDAMVLSRGRQAPRTYGRLLLRLGVAPHPHHALPGASPTFRTLKRRLDMLGQVTDAPPRALTWCLVAAIAVVGVIPWRVVAADGGADSQDTYHPAPPSPPSPPGPSPAAPAPPVPPAPMAAPAPMAPAAPSAPMPPTEITTVQGGNPERSFIFFSDDIHVMNGSGNDFRRAEAARDGADDFVWYREGKQAWVLKDPAYVKRIRDAFARSAQPADGAAMSADKQAELDREQAVLNEQMAKLAQRQAELAVQESDPRGPTDRAAYAAGHAALGKEQAAIAQKMADIGRVRAEQGSIQAEWGRRQAEASRKATKEVDAILAEAIRNHAAKAAR
ncbi:beta-lactamase regulating signal transducer with metallopeptidase domain [Luteibacter jiangsuensis]|uniref:Beta-lactamase regulating signal transducer with metallopeptidase domain n=1 Tax=Luteibacter jiangsuensis TaxID=637577 RepID=A0ABT9T2A2_9GAMM|nr:M56 family metallopeptidase [Luteibacter jiangsuensis]MDQ0011404.1 beta-lactamase regulating signal transducer with metallopeptidase domain [Luteibacter jiangsuensis]